MLRSENEEDDQQRPNEEERREETLQDTADTVNPDEYKNEELALSHDTEGVEEEWKEDHSEGCVANMLDSSDKEEEEDEIELGEHVMEDDYEVLLKVGKGNESEVRRERLVGLQVILGSFKFVCYVKVLLFVPGPHFQKWIDMVLIYNIYILF